MSTLTDKERIGLEEVFLSISKSHKKSHKIDMFSTIKLYSRTFLASKFNTLKSLKLNELLKKGLNSPK